MVPLADVRLELLRHCLLRGLHELGEARRERDIRRRIEERVRMARFAVSASPADPMDIRIELRGHFVVDDMRDIRDIDAPRHDVGGHEKVAHAVLKNMNRILALALREIAVHRAAEHVGNIRKRPAEVLLDLRKDIRGSALSLDEENGLLVRRYHVFLVEIHQNGHLRRPLVVREVAVLLDERVDGVPRLVRAGRDHEVVLLDVLPRELLDLLVPRGGPHQRLRHELVRPEEVHDVVDLRLEAHVQEPVRLVHDEERAPGEVDDALPAEVGQAAGGGHDDVRPVALPRLGVAVLGAAVRVGAADAERPGELLEDGVGLHRELAGGADDEDLAGVHAGVDAREGGDGEREGLAGAGRGEADDVLAEEHHRDRVLLDGRRRDVADAREGAGQALGDGELRPLRVVEAGEVGVRQEVQRGVVGVGVDAAVRHGELHLARCGRRGGRGGRGRRLRGLAEAPAVEGGELVGEEGLADRDEGGVAHWNGK